MEKKRAERPNDTDYIPVPPTIETVLLAFELGPGAANEEQKEAVVFFHKQLLVTLDATLNSDAMIDRSIMATLDLKTQKMKDEQDAAILQSGGKSGGWNNAPNVWASTMATAALFLDKKSGASDTKSIVHNLTRPEGDKKKKTKQFKKTQKLDRANLYGAYFFKFRKIWIKNKRSQNGPTRMVSNLAAWDLFTGMTKQVELSDAQKRARKQASATNETAPEKNLKMSCSAGKSVVNHAWFFDMPDLTSDSNSDSETGRMQSEQDKEVAATHFAL